MEWYFKLSSGMVVNLCLNSSIELALSIGFPELFLKIKSPNPSFSLIKRVISCDRVTEFLLINSALTALARLAFSTSWLCNRQGILSSAWWVYSIKSTPASSSSTPLRLYFTSEITQSKLSRYLSMMATPSSNVLTSITLGRTRIFMIRLSSSFSGSLRISSCVWVTISLYNKGR